MKPWQSGYSTFADNPIYYNDISGDDESAFMGDGEGTPSFGDGEGAGVPTFMGGTNTGGNPNAFNEGPVVSESSSTGDWGQNARAEIDPKSITTNGRVKDGITNLAKNLGIPEGRNVQNPTVDAINSTLASFIPFHDAIKNIHDGTESGDNSLVAMGIIGAGLDVASFGRGGAIVRGGAKGLSRFLGKELFNFTKTAAAHMDEVGRMIPVQTLDDIIKFPMAVAKDPRGTTNAMMYYSQMWKTGKLYNAEVLYDKATNTIMHFKYDTKAMGPLPKLTK